MLDNNLAKDFTHRNIPSFLVYTPFFDSTLLTYEHYYNHFHSLFILYTLSTITIYDLYTSYAFFFIINIPTNQKSESIPL